VRHNLIIYFKYLRQPKRELTWGENDTVGFRYVDSDDIKFRWESRLGIRMRIFQNLLTTSDQYLSSAKFSTC
jgi:hypothetical protein